MVKVKSLIFFLCAGFICNIFASEKNIFSPKKISSLEEHRPKSLLTECIKKYLTNKKNDSDKDEYPVSLGKSDNKEMTKKNKSMFS